MLLLAVEHPEYTLYRSHPRHDPQVLGCNTYVQQQAQLGLNVFFYCSDLDLLITLLIPGRT